MNVQILQAPAFRIEGIWPSIRPGVLDALDESHGEVEPGWILAQLLQGTWTLWVGLIEDEAKGFTITEPLHTAKGTWLNVLFTWSEAGLGAHLMKHGFAALEAHARQNNMRGIKMFSSRKGFKKAAPALGMTPRFVEYVKEFT